MAVSVAPIWKDYIINMGDADSLEFRIRVGSETGEIIYIGKTYRRPGLSRIWLKVNDICADYLHNTIPALPYTEFSTITFPVTFYVQKKVNNAWVTAEEIQFLNDWSYDHSYNVATMGMAAPINGHIDARQWLTYTAFNATSVTATITLADGTTTQEEIPIEMSEYFDVDTDFSRAMASAGSGTAVFDLSEWGDVAKVTIGGKTWEVVTDCKEWVLYYLNAFGGWDSFLIEGLASERDSLTRHTRDAEYDNRDMENRSKHNFVNEIAKSYTLNTSWLSDDESARMHHLLNSTDVYLYNINSGEMNPVILQNTTTEYKTYKGNGGKLVNYAIEVTIAQDRIRR